uniref:MABP domain-containing protein n=1 Tax=Anopheles darlingi TaxID=43151 RepID=A0A2M4CJD2_ANODA
MLGQNNILNTVICCLPDNRPITSLQLIEDLQRVPENFQVINKTYDQDADADLWREKTLISKRTTRYLCQSKTEGLPDYVVSKVKVINEKESVPEGFSQLTRTSDTEQKAWRKKQLVYQLTRVEIGSTVQCITDILLCSRFRNAPQGFTMAGEINGIVICFKLSNASRTPLPTNSGAGVVKVQQGVAKTKIIATQLDRDYVQLLSTYRMPQVANNKTQIYSYSTFKMHAEVDGVPFILNPCLREYGSIKNLGVQMAALEYNFDLERNVLRTTKTLA